MQELTLPLISVIVPVHNAGKYLDRCLSSLQNQKLKNIEIILILDCPTDGSDIIAEKFAVSESRIKIIYNAENLHTGLSRNKGIDIAKGEYLGFLDHDDYCDTNMYELLYNSVFKEKNDIARCNFYCNYITHGVEKIEKYNYPDKTFQIEDKEWIYDYVCGDKVSCVIWNHIYRTDFIRNNNIRFLDSRSICSEDSVFFMEVYLKANDIKVVSDYLYHHVFHSSNTGKSIIYRSLDNRIAFFEKLNFQLREHCIKKEQTIEYLAVNLIKSLYSGFRQIVLNNSINKSLFEFKMLKNNELVNSCVDFLYRKENRNKKYQLKFTIQLFLFFLKK